MYRSRMSSVARANPCSRAPHGYPHSSLVFLSVPDHGDLWRVANRQNAALPHPVCDHPDGRRHRCACLRGVWFDRLAISVIGAVIRFSTAPSLRAGCLLTTRSLTRTSPFPAAGRVAYFDTEGTFRPDRVRPIAARFNLDGDAVLANILYVRAYTFDQQYGAAARGRGARMMQGSGRGSGDGGGTERTGVRGCVHVCPRGRRLPPHALTCTHGDVSAGLAPGRGGCFPAPSSVAQSRFAHQRRPSPHPASSARSLGAAGGEDV